MKIYKILLLVLIILPSLANAKTLQPNNMPTTYNDKYYINNHFDISDPDSFIIFSRDSWFHISKWDAVSRRDIAHFTGDKANDTCTIERKHYVSITVLDTCEALYKKINPDIYKR